MNGFLLPSATLVLPTISLSFEWGVARAEERTSLQALR